MHCTWQPMARQHSNTIVVQICLNTKTNNIVNNIANNNRQAHSIVTFRWARQLMSDAALQHAHTLFNGHTWILSNGRWHRLWKKYDSELSCWWFMSWVDWTYFFITERIDTNCQRTFSSQHTTTFAFDYQNEFTIDASFKNNQVPYFAFVFRCSLTDQRGVINQTVFRCL